MAPVTADAAPRGQGESGTAGAATRGFREALASCGPVGRDLLEVDWAATPLGPPEGWPQSLKTIARAMLTSRFSMWMAWGEELRFFCNEAYRDYTLGTKYPWALGKRADEVWSEIWPDIGPRIEHVIASGEATWDEDLMLFLERSGYVEETYHTFSYSPLADDDGRVNGMLCVVTEDSDRVITERRMALLRHLGSDLASLQSETEVLASVAERLEQSTRSIPFGLVYLLESGAAHLAATAGVPYGHVAAPEVVALDDAAPGWPLARASGGATVVGPLAERFSDVPTGGWSEPPTEALVVPLRQQGQAGVYGYFVAALNPYQRLDSAYRSFVELVAAQIAAGLASARAYEAERRRAEQLAELDAAKTAFFTNVSHELRTPMTLLLGPVEEALADTAEPLPPAQRERFESVGRNAERMLRLVNNLLDFSRLEAGKTTAQYQPIDLAHHTRELTSMFRSAIDRAGLSFGVEIAQLAVPVYVDPEMWAKILLNLLSNAVKFTFSGGIRVALRDRGDSVELSVSDTGIGIEPADQARLFERFHRVVGAQSRSHEGTGIGLALVAELVALHGGTTSLESVPGKGSTFRVRIPLGTAHLEAGTSLSGEAPAPAAGPEVGPFGEELKGYVSEALRWFDDDASVLPPEQDSQHRSPGDERPRLLVVDDNADMRAYLTRLLAGRYAVETAVDGLDALELARADPPDLVLTDVMMPRLDGFGLLRAMRADPTTVGVPVLMLSARAGEEGVTEGLEAGADDYLVKPFSARELLARVASGLELDRVRRMRDELERSEVLLAQAQRLARLGSWEADVGKGTLAGSEEFLRIVGISAHELASLGYERAIATLAHEDDVERIAAELDASAGGNGVIDVEFRLAPRSGSRSVRLLGEPVLGPGGELVAVRGSLQDVTEQREAERQLAAAAASREATAREHRIADALQHSLLPPRTFDPEYLEVATLYRAGVAGTQVGGDWYDVIELGGGRTALVLGDVMGRGVQAAAVMGQIRSAIRAYARLELSPSDVLESCDALVRDLRGDQIVTCVYAVYDPSDRSVAYARAGHLPPLVITPGGVARRLDQPGGPPLGAGPLDLDDGQFELPVGAILALYTDGLIERRNRALDDGIAALAGQLQVASGPLEELPDSLFEALVSESLDDDVAVLLARVPEGEAPVTASWQLGAEADAVSRARRFVAATLAQWGITGDRLDEVVLVASELATNALVHGRFPARLRCCRTDRRLILEAWDAGAIVPRRRHPTAEDEHGRGLQVVEALADQWGTRSTRSGKCVWCVLNLKESR